MSHKTAVSAGPEQICSLSLHYTDAQNRSTQQHLTIFEEGTHVLFESSQFILSTLGFFNWIWHNFQGAFFWLFTPFRRCNLSKTEHRTPHTVWLTQSTLCRNLFCSRNPGRPELTLDFLDSNFVLLPFIEFLFCQSL